MRDPSTELPAGILAPSFTHAEKAEPGTPNGFQNDIRPLKVQRLSDSQAGFQHENGNVMQRLEGKRSDTCPLARLFVDLYAAHNLRDDGGITPPGDPATF